MKLNKNIVTVTKAITTLTEWQVLASPMGGDSQWRDGRSAKELARYITKSLPNMPGELDDLLRNYSGVDASFNWAAEHITDFQAFGFGKGMGRNHDAIIYNEDVFVGIEAKADEPFGDKTIEEELKHASENKKLRIEKLSQLVFGDQAANHLNLRYQLLTACGGVLLEAEHRKINTAVMLVLVFLKKGTDKDGKPYYLEENRLRNDKDWKEFLSQVHAVPSGSGYRCASAPCVCSGIDLYLHKIELSVD